MRGADVDDVVRGSHIGEASVIELREWCFHVDGNGLRESSKGVKAGHEAKFLHFLHSSAAGGVGTTVKKKQPVNELKKPHDHLFGNTRN